MFPFIFILGVSVGKWVIPSLIQKVVSLCVSIEWLGFCPKLLIIYYPREESRENK